MAEWLIIHLRGPFASFAESPGNTTRKTGDMPSRSALIGLAAAALGIERSDQVRQTQLADALVTASALLSSGDILSDFHTFQSLNDAAKGASSRVNALARKEYLETGITRRDYRTDASWQAAYRLSSTAGIVALTELKKAFQQPQFALYLGRRSCPPSHPLNPKLYEAEDVRDAFVAYAEETGLAVEFVPCVFSLEDHSDADGSQITSQHLRRDDPRDRSIRWTFAERIEWRIGPTHLGKKQRPI
jgi:CRISPR system Cascade subunit CasD